MHNERMKRLLPHIAMTLFGAQLLLMLGSWLYSAAQPMSGVRSLLSGEGLRWMFGHFADFLAKPQLVWLLLLSMGYASTTVVRLHLVKRRRWLFSVLTTSIVLPLPIRVLRTD